MDARNPFDDDESLVRLVLAGGAVANRRGLLETHGGPAAALRAGSAAWAAARLDARQRQALALGHPAREAQVRAWRALPGRRVVGWHDADYPPLLRATPSPPLALFVHGDTAALWRPAIAVVGSRAASTAGRDHAREFAHAFARAGLCVVSGLASGIDAAAHQGALDAQAGPTVAVLGCGPDIAYPRGNAALMARIAASGGAVASEHPPGTGPQTAFFPSRNRIIAGLALGTLVVEAHARSGALITARLAGEAGREVFALPGSIRNAAARGCHRLIRDGALLVESPEEVLEVLAPALAREAGRLHADLNPGHVPANDLPSARAGTDAPAAPGDPHRLWQALDHDPIPMDALVDRTGLTVAELSSILLVMELEGRVAVEHGLYSRRAPRRGRDR